MIIRRLFYCLSISHIMEILILIGGLYALYTVCLAIATHIDYKAINK